MLWPRSFAVLFLCAAGVSAQDRLEALLRETPRAGDFPLVQGASAADLLLDSGDFKVVSIAAADLSRDIFRVTGREPRVRNTLSGASASAVLIGTLGRSALVDTLANSGKLDVSALRGAWESFLISTVDAPAPGIDSALVIVGSDRRGTAFGVYELSQAIGVSPWHWWADVVPAKRTSLHIAKGARRFGPPSVKYRGIFLNDEDWGLHPWAAKTFEPEAKGIGPRTYAKVFELLLRLKANTVWPAMHAVTKPFNLSAANARVADDYAMVMGSSHAEPMLRNNVGEWKEPPEMYNYITNRDGVHAYWEERVRANGGFENLYTLGMRGIHDSNMQGPKTDPERIRTLERIFADQRDLLARHVRPEVERVPQIFCAYKEVLSLYRQGLKVPDDVTIVWPDDNHGYIRNYASAGERKRAGGFGVYYHLSYLGAPLSYLWLSTTPPALIWSEMSKAWDLGARTVWIANVGDLKPAEIGTELFLQMAWDIARYPRARFPEFLTDWARRDFGSAEATEIARIMRDYYELNHQRRPEHLQWWRPREAPRASPFSKPEGDERLAAFARLRQRTEAVRSRLDAAWHDAFFELVLYPVTGSALANLRFIAGERGEGDAARRADVDLAALTAEFNDKVAGGKWRGLMSLEPADDQWRSMRIAAWTMPAYASPAEAAKGEGSSMAIEAERFTWQTPRPGGAWEIIPGLGRTGDAVAMFPNTASPFAPEALPAAAPRLDYELHFKEAGEYTLTANLVPTHPIAGTALRFALTLDDLPPRVLSLEVKDGEAEWAEGVLSATRTIGTKIRVETAGAHTLRLFGVDPGVAIDRILIHRGDLPMSYLGPRDTRPAR